MAKMYPAKLPQHVLDNRKLSSEIRVYDRIRDQVPGDYNCYYSRSWHEADDHGAEFDGEADFILAHRENGLLFLEVKGGRVSCRESDGQWISRDRDGFDFRIKNPIAQAKSSKHHFLKRLNADRRLAGRFIRVRHAAVLPGSAKPNPPRDLAPDAPLEIIAFGDEMKSLGDWIVRRMSSGIDPRETPLGIDGMKVVNYHMIGHFELQAHIGVSLAEDAATIERLTGEQAWLLDSFEDSREIAISGGAGSGKTVLAIEKAVRDAREGRRTLLTCYNAPLAKHLQNVCEGEENLEVRSFHSLCRTMASAAGIALANTGNRAYFETELPEALIEAAVLDPELGFDTVVIDEGQDFHDSWLNALRITMKDPDESRFYVFYDNNQRLFTPDQEFIDALPHAGLTLSRNLRNTRRIHVLMLKWYEGKKYVAAGPDGQEVGILECRLRQDVLKQVGNRLRDFLRSGEVTAGQVAILSPHGDPKSFPAKIAGVPTCRADDIRSDAVVYDTVRRFKGLSRPCVFLTGLDRLTDPELIYVATSRANLLLELAGTAEDIASIMKTA